jgi:hypothetical protein
MCTVSLGNSDLPQSKSNIPSTRIASSLVIFTGGFDLVVACNMRRATTSPYIITRSASTSNGMGQSTHEFHKAGSHDKPAAHSSTRTRRMEDSDIPDYDPRYTFHRIIIQMIMDGIQLRCHVSTGMPIKENEETHQVAHDRQLFI